MLVEIGSADDALTRALPVRAYYRGRRIRELSLLGLAAEAAGLSIEMLDGRPVLRGIHGPALRLDPAPAAAAPVGSFENPMAVSITQDIVLPEGFVDQF